MFVPACVCVVKNSYIGLSDGIFKQHKHKQHTILHKNRSQNGWLNVVTAHFGPHLSAPPLPRAPEGAPKSAPKAAPKAVDKAAKKRWTQKGQ